jgi:hypothetical protein
MICFLSCFLALLIPDENVFSVDFVSAEQPIECKLNEIRVGKIFKFEVVVTNRTGKKLQIESIMPSCGCTIASLPEGKSIEANGKFRVAMTVQPTELDNFSKAVAFYEKDGNSPCMVIQMVGKVVDPLKCNLPQTITLDPSSFKATADIVVESAFDDVTLDFKNVAIVGDSFRGFSEKKTGPKELSAVASFGADDGTAFESLTELKVAYTDPEGTFVRQYRCIVRMLPKLSSTPRKLRLSKINGEVALVRFGLVGVFERGKEITIRASYDGKILEEIPTVPMSDRLAAIRFTLGKESPIWNVDSGKLTLSTDTESVDIPFSFED